MIGMGWHQEITRDEVERVLLMLGIGYCAPGYDTRLEAVAEAAARLRIADCAEEFEGRCRRNYELAKEEDD